MTRKIAQIETRELVVLSEGKMETAFEALSGPVDPVIASNWQSLDQRASFAPTAFERPTPGPNATTIANEILVFERRTFVRDCLVHCLKDKFSEEIVGFASVDEFESGSYRPGASALFIICASGRQRADIDRDRSRLQLIAASSSIIVLGDDETPACVDYALKSGVKGYIPTSVTANVAIGALSLIRAGGVFIPASYLTNMREESSGRREKPSLEDLFTARQRWVIGEIRKGKSNKVIANELKIEVTTVKVHVRNIMRKLKAHSRTEVAFIVSQMESHA